MTRCVCLALSAGWLWLPLSATAGPPKEKDAKPPPKLSPRDLEAQWTALVGADAAAAYKAIWALVADPERSVPFLAKRLRPVPPLEPGRLEKLVDALDSKRFPEREKAMAELEKMGALAKAILEKKLAAKPSLEMQRRLERLLDKLSVFTLAGEDLRIWRALEALEYIGNAAVQQILRRLAAGAPGADQTEWAQGALDRLSKRVAAAP